MCRGVGGGCCADTDHVLLATSPAPAAWIGWFQCNFLSPAQDSNVAV